jgi:hypothetical protein
MILFCLTSLIAGVAEWSTENRRFWFVGICDFRQNATDSSELSDEPSGNDLSVPIAEESVPLVGTQVRTVKKQTRKSCLPHFL